MRRTDCDGNRSGERFDHSPGEVRRVPGPRGDLVLCCACYGNEINARGCAEPRGWPTLQEVTRSSD